MHGLLHHSLVVAASLTACALAIAPGPSAVAQPTPAELSAPDLRELENLLSELGFDPGPVDGKVDEATLSAIKRYQEFASLPGDPEPSHALLAELRGVAAAFAALRNDTMPDTGAAPAADASETTGNAPVESPRREAPERKEEATDPAEAETEIAEPEIGEAENNVPDPADRIAEKVIVPPPPMPPKLKPLDAPPGIAPKPAQTAARPSDDADAEIPDPVDARQAMIEAELAPYREELANRSLTREDLAKQFNILGRQLLQAADYDAAILKFDVAIHLNPRFAGAYSNRGTAYELQKKRELAAQDFDKARQLGFGGVRPKAEQNPLR